MLAEELNNYELKPLKDVAFLIKHLDSNNHHFGSGTNTVDTHGNIHFMQGGEFGKADTFAIMPPLFDTSNLAFNFELQVAMKQIELQVTQDKLENLMVRVYPKDIQLELLSMAKNVSIENSSLLKSYIYR